MRADKDGLFHAPVDAEALGIPDYHTVITAPMDLGTVKAKHSRGRVRHMMPSTSSHTL